MAGSGFVADLVTHLCSVLIPGTLLPKPVVTALAVGTAVPDLAARLPAVGLGMIRRAGAPIPGSADAVFEVCHMPVGIVLTSILLGTLVHPDQRRSATTALVLGGALHMAMDVLQNHFGNGYYMCFPFSVSRWELGWIGSEATVPLAPWFASVTAVLWASRWLYDRRRHLSDSDGD